MISLTVFLVYLKLENEKKKKKKNQREILFSSRLIKNRASKSYCPLGLELHC